MNTNPPQNKRLRDTVSGVFKQDRPFDFGFRMLPMIDMLFLLLIFFLLTMQFRPVESYLPFQLPGESGAAAQIGKAEPLTLNLTARDNGCRIQIGHTKAISIDANSIDTDLTAVANRIMAVIKEQKRTAADPVEFVCDRGVEWQYIAKLYNILFGMGIKDITFRMTE
ncbi:MAG: biopolymer transporter ExbD [Sedimentisphaerales bacterium]|nr:biopolymer transporter ExbD [Sedimentisphaerales bacterium]